MRPFSQSSANSVIILFIFVHLVGEKWYFKICISIMLWVKLSNLSYIQESFEFPLPLFVQVVNLFLNWLHMYRKLALFLSWFANIFSMFCSSFDFTYGDLFHVKMLIFIRLKWTIHLFTVLAYMLYSESLRTLKLQDYKTWKPNAIMVSSSILCFILFHLNIWHI